METNPQSVSSTRNTNGHGTSSLALMPMADKMALAKNIVESRMFGFKSVAEVVTLGAVAEAQGKHPATVCLEYHVIQGRPALKADAMLARFQQAGGAVQWIERTDKACAANFSHSQGGSLEVRWTLDDAKRAGLLNGKSNWTQYPRQMLSARVVSEGVRAVFPGVLGGFYTPEEVSQFEPVAAPAKYARPEASSPVLTDEPVEVIDVQPVLVDPPREKAAPLFPKRKKQPVAAMDEGADWEPATLIEKSTKSGNGAKGPWTVWKATLEMDNGKKLYPSTFDAELGAVLEECQEGETILVQVASREYVDKNGETKKGYDLKAVSRQDVPAKAEDKATELAENDIPF